MPINVFPYFPRVLRNKTRLDLLDFLAFRQTHLKLIDTAERKKEWKKEWEQEIRGT